MKTDTGLREESALGLERESMAAVEEWWGSKLWDKRAK